MERCDIMLVNIIGLFLLDAIISILVYMLMQYQYGYAKTNEEHPNFFAPWVVHKFTKLNWFGAVLFSLFLMVICWVYVIIYFIWWILHVGRKEDKKE